jgi:predicted molibdopterin-dependent oxidoreductase YjgC
MTNEQLLNIKSFAEEILKTNKLGGCRVSRASMFLERYVGVHSGSASYDSIGNADFILVVGFDIKKTNPVAALMIKKAIEKNNKAKFVILSEEKTSAGNFATDEYR